MPKKLSAAQKQALALGREKRKANLRMRGSGWFSDALSFGKKLFNKGKSIADTAKQNKWISSNANKVANFANELGLNSVGDLARNVGSVANKYGYGRFSRSGMGRFSRSGK